MKKRIILSNKENVRASRRASATIQRIFRVVDWRRCGRGRGRDALPLLALVDLLLELLGVKGPAAPTRSRSECDS